MSSAKDDRIQQSLKYPELSALIIGISKYQHADNDAITNPRYASRDAEAFADLLRDTLGVKKIRVLLDESATRQNILNEIESLYTEDDADMSPQRSDPIVIFFAGHGHSIAVGEEYHCRNNKLTSLAPSDITTIFSTAEEDVPGIPNRFLGHRLKQMAEVRGNNITLILDCCYSAGMDRDGKSVRGIDSSYLTPHDYSTDLRSIEDSTSRSGGFWTASDSSSTDETAFSHVLLAACSEDDLAMDDPDVEHGGFTGALLRYFQDGVTSSMTYATVIQDLEPLKWEDGSFQQPHCGPRALVNRLLFSTKLVTSAIRYGETRHDAATQPQYILPLGDLHGIAEGVEFTIYASINAIDSAQALGKMIVSAMGEDEVHLSFRESQSFAQSLPPKFFALQTTWTTRLSIFCLDIPWLYGFASEASLRRSGIIIVDSPSKADVEVVAEDTEYELCRNVEKEDHLTSAMGIRIRGGLPARNLSIVLDHTAQFYHHLRRRGNHTFDEVSIELQYAEKDQRGWYYEPTGELIPLRPLSPGPDYTTTLILPRSTQGPGYKSSPITLIIHNGDSEHIFAHVFYFDTSTLEIKQWYSPYSAKGRGADAPLLPRGAIRVGCAGSGVKPWVLGLVPRQDVDCGWLKVFLSTMPLNLDSIMQGDAFTGEENATRSDTDETELIRTTRWEARSIALIHKREDDAWIV